MFKKNIDWTWLKKLVKSTHVGEYSQIVEHAVARYIKRWLGRNFLYDGLRAFNNPFSLHNVDWFKFYFGVEVQLYFFSSCLFRQRDIMQGG